MSDENIELKNEAVRPEITVQTPSVEDEIARALDYANDTKPHTVFPTGITPGSEREKIIAAVRRDFDPNFYTAGAATVEAALPKIAEACTTLQTYKERWGFDYDPSFDILLTRYGTAGSYRPGKNRVVIRVDRNGNTGHKDAARDVVHELVHLAIEHLIERCNVAQGDKEEIVRRISATMFPDIFRDLADEIGADELARYRGLLPDLPSVFESMRGLGRI